LLGETETMMDIAREETRHRPVERLESCHCFSLKHMVNVPTRWILDVKITMHRHFLGKSRLPLTIRRVAILTDVSWLSSVSWGILWGEKNSNLGHNVYAHSFLSCTDHPTTVK
jgi:hypothetical protein